MHRLHGMAVLVSLNETTDGKPFDISRLGPVEIDGQFDGQLGSRHRLGWESAKGTTEVQRRGSEIPILLRNNLMHEADRERVGGHTIQEIADQVGIGRESAKKHRSWMFGGAATGIGYLEIP